MGTKKKLRICLCSICRTLTHDDMHGLPQQGCLLELRKWKQHQADDELRADEEDHLLYAALVTSASDDRARRDSLPSRPRDFEPSVAPPHRNARDYRPKTQSHSAEVDARIASSNRASSPVSDSGVMDMNEDREGSPPSSESGAMDTSEDVVRLSPLSESGVMDTSEDMVIDTIAHRTQELAIIESAICHELRLLPTNPNLIFQSPPAALSDPPAPLLPSNLDTRQFIALHASLENKQHVMRLLPPLGERSVDRHRWKLLQNVEEELHMLSAIEMRAWECQKLLNGLYGLRDEAVTNSPRVYLTDHLYVARRVMQPVVLMALIVVSALHTLSGLNRESADLVLLTIRAVLTGVYLSCNQATTPVHPSWLAITARHTTRAYSKLTPSQQAILDSVPRDICTVLSHLKVEPDILRYAACPLCSHTYPPNLSNPDNPYPHICSSVETDGPPCNSPLVRKVARAPTGRRQPAQVVYTALRPYPYRTLFSWITNLFSRKPAEELVETAWERTTPVPGSRFTDIMQAPGLRNFRGPDGQLYSSQSNGDVHLVFGLFIDWFNPGGNKQAGKSRSIGAIYLVCLNLPPELRFLPENICLLAIIPGPNEPSLHQLNNFLRPLIDELLILWHFGIRLSRTAHHSGGRLVHAIVIPLICDLPALRKTAGFASHSSKHFCSFCLLKKSEMNDLSRPWPSRTWKEHLAIATQWRDAKTQADRDAIFEEHGLRWSELLRLPYWDPTRYAVVDAMHNLFLGELRHHCTSVWGIDVKDKATTTKATPHTPDEQQKWLELLVAALCKGNLSAVMQPRKGYLVALSQLNGVSQEPKLTKRAYAKALLAWVQTHSIDELIIPPVLCKATVDFHLAQNEHDISKFSVLTAAVIEQLRSDIKMTYLPSWMERPPANFGSAAHGKLKADHWRTICTVSMVITLVRLWSATTATIGERLLLENFIHLVIAIDLATRRSMDSERARLYDHHMLEYLRTLRRLFEHDLVPNHHLSLHLASCLILFGPVRGWWAYPFERYNGIIQRLNTNHNIAQIPLTFMRLFHAGAELRWMMSSVEWPDADELGEVMRAFNGVYRDSGRGTRASDLFSTMSTSPSCNLDALFNRLNDERLDKSSYLRLFHLIDHMHASAGLFSSYDSDLSDSRPQLPLHVRYLATLDYGRAIYGTRSKSIRNSFVCFRDPLSDKPSILRAGQIHALFLHSRIPPGQSRAIQPFVVVDEYVPLSQDHSLHDPYHRFPLLDTQLYYNQFRTQKTVIRMEDIHCHFAAFVYKPEGINEECVVVRSLDRS